MIPGAVTVITPAIEYRFGRFLNECLDSVRQQTVRPYAHLIGVDYARRDNAVMQNQLAATVDTEWLVLLADDDMLYPTHLERCLEVADGFDVVYPYADMSTWPSSAPQAKLINQPWDPERIKVLNWIPGGCALIRTEMWNAVGGCSTSRLHRHNHDWIMWQQIAAAGGRFRCIPEPLWLYRFHDAQKEALVDGRAPRVDRELHYSRTPQ